MARPLARSAPQKQRYVVHPARVAPSFNRLPEEVRTLLRLCDGTRSLRTLRTETGLAPLVFEQIIDKLETLGFIEIELVPRRKARSTGAAIAWVTEAPAQEDSALAFEPTLRMPLVDEPDPLPPPPASVALPSLPFAPPPLELVLADFSFEEEAFFSRTIDHLLEPEERPSPPLEMH